MGRAIIVLPYLIPLSPTIIGQFPYKKTKPSVSNVCNSSIYSLSLSFLLTIVFYNPLKPISLIGTKVLFFSLFFWVFFFQTKSVRIFSFPICISISVPLTFFIFICWHLLSFDIEDCPKSHITCRFRDSILVGWGVKNFSDGSKILGYGLILITNLFLMSTALLY